MEIINYIDLFLGALLNVIFYCIIIRKIFKIKMTKNRYIKYGVILILSLCISLINIFNKNIFKALMTIPLVAIGIYKLFDIKLTNSIYYTIVSSFYLLIGEILATFVLSIFNNKYNFFTVEILGNTVGNILVIVSTIPLLYINFISKIFQNFSFKKINSRTMIIIFISFLVIGSAFVFKNPASIENIILSIMNSIIFIFFVVLLYISYIEKQKVNKISEEYNSLLNYLDKYEKEIVEKRKLIHDFKNQIIIINGYIGDDYKLREYVNEIIEEQKNIKESKIVKNIDKLPRGLKGLVYYKLSQIDSQINIDLNVKSKFKEFDNLDSKDTKDILKIVGILLDNAIEGSTKAKEKYIVIEISMSKHIFKMNIENSHNDKIEKFKITDPGFSTKGKNRGYGLSLVNDIVKNNGNYNLSFNITNSTFKTIFTVNVK